MIWVVLAAWIRLLVWSCTPTLTPDALFCVRGTETLRWIYDAAGALVRVEYFDSAQPENAWVKVLVTDEGARVRAVCLYGVQDEAKTGFQSAEFASAVEDAQAWLPQCPESVEVEGVTLVPVSTSVFSYDGNDSRLLQVSSDGSGSALTYGAAGFVNSVASWGSADDSAVSFSLLCASTDGRVLAAGGAPAGVPEFGVPSIGAGAAAGSAAGFDASVMHPLVWDENSFVPRVLGVAGSSLPSVGSLVPGAGSGAGLLDPYGWASLGVAAPAVPSAQGASATGGAPVLPDSLVGVSAASGLVLGSTGLRCWVPAWWIRVWLVLRRLILWLRLWVLVGVLIRSHWWVVTRFLWWIRGVCRRCRWRILRSIVSRKRLLVLPVG